MKYTHAVCSTILSLSALSASAQETIKPTQVTSLNVSITEPYCFVGLLATDVGFGSASLIADGVVATAAHVIFDDSNFTWTGSNAARFYRRTNAFFSGEYPSSSYVNIVGWIKWDSYSTRVQNDNSEEGLSSYDTFNLDSAVGYFTADDNFDRYAEFSVDSENSVSILRDNRDKTIIGYPLETGAILFRDKGKMHETIAGNYEVFWSANDSELSTWRDSENFFVSTYDFYDVITYGGNSGGPAYVIDDLGNWVQAGVLVGGSDTDSLVRGMDDNTFELSKAAFSSVGFTDLIRVEDLNATTVTEKSVSLAWTDKSSAETAYRILRKYNHDWEILAEVPANSTTYLDTNIVTGAVYHYCLQAITDINRAPKSNVVKAEIPGSQKQLANFLGAKGLLLQSRGDNSFSLDTNRIRSGKVRSLGQSSLELRLIGPGKLTFSWSSSSEVNPYYNDPTDLDYLQIWDALRFEQTDGVTADFLSGFIQKETKIFDLPAGPQKVKWVYGKDPYASEGDDAGFLYSLNWQPAESAPMIYGAFAFDDVWQGSAWFGIYSANTIPWIRHLELGWLYLYAKSGNGIYFYSSLPNLGTLYTSPDVFPYIYRTSTASWLYYYPGTGSSGSGAWFYDVGSSSFFKTN